MVDRARGPIQVGALRIGRTEVGAATALLDDDALTLVRAMESEERPIRLRLSSIDSLHGSGDEIDLVLRDGTHVTIVSPESGLRDDLLDRCRSIPELTRNLRVFGSSRRRAVRPMDATEQQRFFAPLLEARRTASNAEGAAAVAAFNGSALMAALEGTLKQFAADRHAEAGPQRRALEAELIDASEPLFDALRALRESAKAATAAADDLRIWRAWSSQLRATFETADRVWVAVDAALDEAHRASIPKPKSK